MNRGCHKPHQIIKAVKDHRIVRDRSCLPLTLVQRNGVQSSFQGPTGPGQRYPKDFFRGTPAIRVPLALENGRASSLPAQYEHFSWSVSADLGSKWFRNRRDDRKPDPAQARKKPRRSGRGRSGRSGSDARSGLNIVRRRRQNGKLESCFCTIALVCPRRGDTL